MNIYIDSEFKCHISNQNGTYLEIDEPFFDGKCQTFIEGYRLKPEDETWVREDGKVFSGGKMISPWKPYSLLAATQAQYESDLSEAAAAYQEGVDSV